MESIPRLTFSVSVVTLMTTWSLCSGQGPPYPPARYRSPPPYHPTYIVHRSPPVNHMVPGRPMPYYRPQRPMYPLPPQPYPTIHHGQPSYDRPVVIQMRRKRPVIIMEEADDSGERPIIIRKRPKKAKRRKISTTTANADYDSREDVAGISQLLRTTSNDPYGTRYKIAGTFHLDNRGNLVGIDNGNVNNDENEIGSRDSTESYSNE